MSRLLLVGCLLLAACASVPAGPLPPGYGTHVFAAAGTPSPPVALDLYDAQAQAARATAAVSDDRATSTAVWAATAGNLEAAATNQHLSQSGTAWAAGMTATTDEAERLLAVQEAELALQSSVGTATVSALHLAGTATAERVALAYERERQKVVLEGQFLYFWAILRWVLLLLFGLLGLWLGLVVGVEIAGCFRARAAREQAEADYARAKASAVPHLVLTNPELQAEQAWIDNVLRFAERGDELEPHKFSERELAASGVSYDTSRLYARIMAKGGILRRTNGGSMWAGGWDLGKFTHAVKSGRVALDWPRGTDGQLLPAPGIA